MSEYIPDPSQEAVAKIAQEAAITAQRQLGEALNDSVHSDFLQLVADARISRIRASGDAGARADKQWLGEPLCDPFMQIGYECVAAQLNRLVGVFCEIHDGNWDFMEVQKIVSDWVLARSTDRFLDRDDLKENGFSAAASSKYL